MDKPLTIMYEEFKQELANLINECGLPAFIIEPVLQSYLSEVRVAATKQYQMDKVQYEDSLKKKETKKKED